MKPTKTRRMGEISCRTDSSIRIEGGRRNYPNMSLHIKARDSLIGPIIIWVLLLCVALTTAHAATITVSYYNDSGPGSLRQALAAANDGDTINFNSSLNGQITLTSGQLMVDKGVNITGPGANRLAVSANHASRVFYIAAGKDVTISGLTITNGSAPSPNFGGGIYNDHATLTLSSCTISGNSAVQGVGGGIFNYHGILAVTNSTLSGNSSWYGGGICNNWGGGSGATATITNSTISGNSAITAGGGIYNEYANLTVSNSTISGNSTTYGGGGIYNAGFNISATSTLAINNSTFSGNSASSGGGIYNDFAGTATMTNCTFSGNSAGGFPNVFHDGTGGGIWNTQTLTMTNSTFSNNSATNHGGGIYNSGVNGYTTTTLKIGNTILNTGTSGENIY